MIYDELYSDTYADGLRHERYHVLALLDQEATIHERQTGATYDPVTRAVNEVYAAKLRRLRGIIEKGQHVK